MILVQVTQQHINESKPNEPIAGILSNAIADAFEEFVQVYVDGPAVTIYSYDNTQDEYKETQTAELPVIATLNRDRFDAGTPIAPFSFYVDL